MDEASCQDRRETGPAMRLHPRRTRVAEAVYQRLDGHTGQPMPGKFEFTYRYSTGRQRWQTPKGDTNADAKAQRAEMVARLHRGERVERSGRTPGEVAPAWLALIAMNQMCRFAVRRGWIGVNPVAQMELGEKPRWRVEHVRILEGADLRTLLGHTSTSRAMFEFPGYTGLRIGEALGLRWCDVDFEAGLLRVRQQLSRHRTPKHLKTDAARREVVLAPAMTRLLRERWFASAYKAETSRSLKW